MRFVNASCLWQFKEIPWQWFMAWNSEPSAFLESSSAKVKRGFHSCILFPSKVYGKVSNKPQKAGTNLNMADIILHMFLFQWTLFTVTVSFDAISFLFTLWTINFSHSINFLICFAFWTVWLFVHIYFNASFLAY